MPAFTYTTRVAMHETDAEGIVYFANYFHYAEEAETHALASLGLVVTRDGHAYPRVHAEVDYSAPLHFFERVEVRARLTRLGNSSLHWRFELSGESGPVAVVRVVAARRHRADGSAAPFSETERALLAQLM